MWTYGDWREFTHPEKNVQGTGTNSKIEFSLWNVKLIMIIIFGAIFTYLCIVRGVRNMYQVRLLVTQFFGRVLKFENSLINNFYHNYQCFLNAYILLILALQIYWAGTFFKARWWHFTYLVPVLHDSHLYMP